MLGETIAKAEQLLDEQLPELELARCPDGGAFALSDGDSGWRRSTALLRFPVAGGNC